METLYLGKGLGAAVAGGFDQHGGLARLLQLSLPDIKGRHFRKNVYASRQAAFNKNATRLFRLALGGEGGVDQGYLAGFLPAGGSILGILCFC